MLQLASSSVEYSQHKKPSSSSYSTDFSCTNSTFLHLWTIDSFEQFTPRMEYFNECVCVNCLMQWDFTENYDIIKVNDEVQLCISWSLLWLEESLQVKVICSPDSFGYVPLPPRSGRDTGGGVSGCIYLDNIGVFNDSVKPGFSTMEFA